MYIITPSTVGIPQNTCDCVCMVVLWFQRSSGSLTICDAIKPEESIVGNIRDIAKQRERVLMFSWITMHYTVEDWVMASCRPILCCITADIVKHELWRDFPQILLPGLLYSVILPWILHQLLINMQVLWWC